MREAERGQTLPESVFFLPIVLLALFGTIYVSQFWVVAERTQLTIRYGSPATNPTAAYNVSNIYNAANSPTGFTCSAPPIAVMWDGAPLPGPTSAPYWLPTSWTTPTCTPTFSNNQGAQFLALYVESTLQTVSTTLVAPLFLQKYAGLSATGVTTTASEAFARPADPASIMCHSKEVNSRVMAALNAPSPAPIPSPVGSPSPLPFGSVC